MTRGKPPCNSHSFAAPVRVSSLSAVPYVPTCLHVGPGCWYGQKTSEAYIRGLIFHALGCAQFSRGEK